jgi:hypothetical protein
MIRKTVVTSVISVALMGAIALATVVASARGGGGGGGHGGGIADQSLRPSSGSPMWC